MAQAQGQYVGPSGFGTPPPAAPQMNNVGLPDALASIPEEQKVILIYITFFHFLVIRVVANRAC